MSQEPTTKWLICRICLKNDGKILYNIFEPIAKEEIKDLGSTLLDKIEICGAIKLNQQQNLPNKICNRCVLLLRAAYKFRDLCRQSQYLLEQFITTLPQNEESEEALEVHYDSVAEEQETKVHEELPENVNFIGKDLGQYDSTLLKQDQTLVSKQFDFMAANQDDNVDFQDFSIIENQLVEEVDNVVLISEDNENENKTQKYEKDTKSDNHSTEEQLKKAGKHCVVIHANQGIPAVKRKQTIGKGDDDSHTDQPMCINQMKIHLQVKPHECEVCKKCFSTALRLSRHMNCHTGNRPYKCQYCDASFGDPSTKIKHQRIHTNERPYKCSLCDKAFTYSNVLKVHMMAHTGEKPYTCKYCGKNFTQKHYKNIHEKRHTQNA